MARTVPVYAFQAADGSTIRFAVDSDFWITNLTGDDGLDVEMTEQQSTGQTGKTITGQSVGSRSLTVTGSILRDLDANEALLKRLIRPKEAARWLKTVGDTTWYLDVLPAHTPDVSGGEHLLNFQFKLKAAYPYWRTVETAATMLGGLEGSWFPTPVSTAGSWYISKYKKDVYTTVVNSGSTETEFVLTLTAAARVKNPMLWHNGKRSYLKLNKEIYDEITNEELTSPDLSAGYLYTARRVAEHVPESREVMQGTVTEDDPKGLEHIISGYDVYEDCQLYHRYTVAELAERQQAEIEASTIVLDDATKLSLMLAEIPTEAKPTIPPKLGYKWVPTYSGTAGFAWELQEDPNAYGTNDRPLYWVDGMTVCTGYYYTDGDKLYMALQDGAAPALTDTEWFEVV